MATTVKLQNRSLLREHADTNPIDDATFEKAHSFIFPGDEITLYNKIKLPQDAGAASMNNIVFKNAKTSIVAQKPNPFSRIFSKEFKALREFDLDAFTLAFNNSNLTIASFGVDGYAAVLNYAQDRNFKLPPADFHKQIKFFTKYIASVPAPELIVNGDFVGSLAGWSVVSSPPDWVWDTGTAKAPAIDNSELSQSIVTEIGKEYTFKFDLVNYISNQLDVEINGIIVGSYTANGNYTLNFTATGVSTGVRFFVNFPGVTGNFSGSIDNVSAKLASSIEAEWDYWFYFPLLFRWEYWKTLAAADNDFYNNTEPQNGKNQKWQRYTLPPTWLVKQRFELNLLVSSIVTSLIAEYNLSNEALGINDYSANTDYITKSIKTGAIGSSPTNAPAIVFGYQDTAVYGYFTKVTPFGDEEMGNLVGVIWIEPLQGAGTTARTRASSVYPITAETVFKNIGNELYDDLGNPIGIFTDDINGTIVTFDPLNNQNIIVASLIDYQKLLATYPGITKFTIYCRLYNGTVLLAGSTTTLGVLNVTGEQYVKSGDNKNYTVAGIPVGYTLQSVLLPTGWEIITTGAIIAGSQIFNIDVAIGSGTLFFTYENSGDIITTQLDVYSGATKMGEEIKQDLVLVLNNPSPPLQPVLTQNPTDCPFILPAFADPANPTVRLKNDKSDFLFYGDTGITAIAITLQKNTSLCGDGTWQDKQTIADQTLGDWFAFGKAPDLSGNNFIDDFDKKYTGLFLDWLKVYNAYGAGQYRLKIVYTTITAGTNTAYSAANYCLQQYRTDLIDGTIRVETLNEGIRGTQDNYKVQIDYGTASALNNTAYKGWKGEIRFPGIFYSIKPSYTKEYNQYGDDDNNALKPIINELTPKYMAAIKPAPGWVEFYWQTCILQADNILITDYNAANRHIFVQTPVMNDNGTEVKDENFSNPDAIIEISLQHGQNNLRKRNS